MQRALTSGAAVILLVLSVGLTGCQTAGLRMLRVIGLSEDPLAIALIVEQRPEEALKALNPFQRYTVLQRTLSADVDRPVSIEPCFVFQSRVGLDSGWYQLAVATPAQYAELAETLDLRVLAAPVDDKGEMLSRAVMIVRADSPIEEVAQLRGQAVAFGPVDSTLTHHAALQLIRSAGLKRTDLALDAVPVPGSLRHMPHPRAVAQAVANGSAAAGFITEADWQALPETDPRENEPARDDLRVVAHTLALPKCLLVASPKLDEPTVMEVREFLLAVGRDHPEAVAPLDIQGYEAVGKDVLSRCRQLRSSDSQESVASETPPVDEN